MDVRAQLRAVGRRVRALSPRTVILIAFAGFVVYAFPGYMSTDSIIQLDEARRLAFSDGHPPLMAAEWSILDRIISGPVLMLLLQGALFLGGLYYLYRHVVSPRAAAWIALATLWFPPVLTPMAVIWKDSQMAAYLVAGIAALLQPRLRTRLIGLGLLVFACASRHNGAAAALPLVFFVFEWRTGIRWWKRVALSFAVVVVVTLGGIAITRTLATTHPILTTVYPDVVGMIAHTRDRSDEDLRHLLRGTSLAYTTDIQKRARKLSELGGSTPIVVGEDRLFDQARTPEEWDALYRARRELLRDDPWSYFGGHWRHFSELLGLGVEYLRAPVWNLFMEEDVVAAIGHNAGYSGAQLYLGRAFNWLATYTPMFRPYVYACVALLLLALCCRDRVSAALLTSGLLYELSFFPVGVNPDYRYSHWMVTATCIAAVILFVHRMRTRAR